MPQLHINSDLAAVHEDVASPITPGKFTKKASHKIPLSAMFLCQFDMKKGNQVTWSMSKDKVDLKGIEFKAIPSGLHDKSEDIVSFVVPKDNGEFYYGVAVFKQNSNELNDQDLSARRGISMFSLGIVVDPVCGGHYDWTPNKFISALEYVEDLHQLIEQFFDTNDTQPLEKFYQGNSIVLNQQYHRRASIAPNFTLADTRNPHMLLQVLPLFEGTGPLIFTLWKRALLRERIIMLNCDSIYQNNAFAYCLSVISTIPQEIINSLDHSKQFVQPLYTVGVNDIDYLSGVENSYVASSNDDILIFKEELYDTTIQFKDTPVLLSHSQDQDPHKATQNDMRQFIRLLHTLEIDTRYEWWAKVVEPPTWAEFICQGMYWWASAGSVQDQDTEISLYDDTLTDLNKILSIVGFFHDSTKKIFTKLTTIIDEHNVRVVNGEEHEDTIHIEPADLSAMGLDIYSLSDHKFVEQLVRKWWNREAVVSIHMLGAMC